jgi:hypothetical protein
MRSQIIQSIAIAGACFVAVTVVFAQTSTRTNHPQPKNQTSRGRLTAEIEKLKDEWNYRVTKDEMTDATVKSASHLSEDEKATLVLIDKNGIERVSYQLTNSQFYCDGGENHDLCDVNLRVGTGPVLHFYGTIPSTDDTSMIWLNHAGELINAVRNAAAFKIQVNEFQEGMVVHTFTNGKPLTWPLPGTLPSQ